MGSMKVLGVCLVGAMALSAVVSASASATSNPKWALCETRGTGGQWKNAICTEPQASGTYETRLLLTNETRSITAVANGAQKLSSSTVTIECKKLKLTGSAILRGGEPAGDSETIIYEECSVEGHPNCKVKNKGGTFGTIETKLLGSTVGYASKEAEEKANQAATVTIFAPASGKVWFEIEMETECPSKALEKIGLPTDGELACEDVGNEHLVEHEINCPSPRISTYWLQSGGSPKEETVKKLEIAGLAATYTGKSKISLAGSQICQAWWLD